MKVFQFTVSYDDAGQRLDGFLAAKTGLYSKRKVKSMIDAGLIDVNGKRQKMASYSVARGDQIKLHDPGESSRPSGAHLSLKDSDILSDTAEYVVINKPPGLASQQTKDPKFPHVLGVLEDYYQNKKITLASPLILVHRLDLETSGVLIVAKTSRCATVITEQFRNREVLKIYLALSQGRCSSQQFVETAPLSEIDKKTGNVRPVRAGGKQAVTEFSVLDQREDIPLTLLECRPKTGRSHQIRVHLDINGLPILGDKRYGASKRRLLPPGFAQVEQLASKYHCLHAAQLTFRPLPKSDSLTLKAPLPPHFKEILEVVKLNWI
jgi:RluA family pseudouridine synthase